MQVRLSTTITTTIELLPGVTVEDAKAEIFAQYSANNEVEDLSTGLVLAQGNSVQFDEIVDSETKHSFEEVK